MIKLLDGKEWEYKELLDNMYEDAFYYGYLGKAALSSSSMKKLLLSVEDYEQSLVQKNDTKALIIGRLVHIVVLEPNRTESLYEFADCKTRGNKIYKDLRDTSSKEVALVKDYQLAKDLNEAVRSHSVAGKLLQDGKPEVPEIGYIYGLPVRGKADWLRDDMIVDLKTTSNIDDFDYNCTMFGYDIQAYLYTTLFKRSRFVFIAVDKKSYKVKVVEATDEMIKEGEEKVKRAIENYVKGYF